MGLDAELAVGLAGGLTCESGHAHLTTAAADSVYDVSPKTHTGEPRPC